MRKIWRFLGVMVFAASMGLMSCEERKEIDMGQLYDYQDSLAKIVPTASSVQAKVERDNMTEAIHLKAIVCVGGFYDASPEQLQETARKAGEMAISVFGNGIDRGQLILTKIQRDHDEDPADGIKTDMGIKSLKKAAEGK